MKNLSERELDINLVHKLQHYQMSLQLILKECENKDLKISQANAEVTALREHQTIIEDEKERLRQIAETAKVEAHLAKKSLIEIELECTELKERLEASRSVFEALIESRRFFGVNRGKFQRKVINISQRTSTSWPQAVRHAVLLAEARKVLETRF